MRTIKKEKHVKRQTGIRRRMISMGLSCALVLTSFTGIAKSVSIEAASGSADSTNVNDMTSLDALGISQDKPEDYDQNALNPYGKNVVQMQTVSELFTVEGWDGETDEFEHYVNVRYNQYGKNSALLKGEASVLNDLTRSVSTTKDLDYYILDKDYFANWTRYGYEATLSVEGNFSIDNEGKKKQVVSIWPYAQDESDYGLAMLDIVDASDPNRQLNKFIQGAPIYSYEATYTSYGAVTNDWNWLNMTSLKTGDFDGDGIDEIAYTTRTMVDTGEMYSSDTSEDVYLHILKLQKQEGDGWMNAANWKEVFSTRIARDRDADNPYESQGMIINYAAAVSVGDFNRDGLDDIATVCANNNYYIDSNADVTFYWGERAGDMLKNKSTLRLEGIENAEKNEILVHANVAIGDVDGDGDNELVAAGVSNHDIFRRHIMIYDWNGEGFVLSASKTFNLFEKNDQGQYVNEVMTGRNDREFYSITGGKVNLAVGAFNGFGQPDAIYMDSMIFSFQDNDLVLTGIYDKSFSVSGKDYIECNVRAADFDGDGTEVPVIQMIHLNDYKNKGISYNAGTNRGTRYSRGEQIDVVIPYMEEKTVKVKTYHNKNMSYALPDIDNDTSYLRYKNVHYYKYSDPKILAVLASPPYFQDLDNDAFDGAGELNCTSYSTTKGSGSGSSYANTFHIGAYVSYEKDISVFGIKVGQVEWETEVQNQFTWETEKVSTKEYEASYETLSGQDTVVLFSVPMETFEYEADIPVTDSDGNVIKTDTETIGINLPHTPCVKTIALDKYERIAKDYNELPQISESILTHTVGFPDSYPKQTSDLRYVDDSFEILIAPDMKSAAPATDYGKGAQVHSITMGTERTDSFNYDIGVDFKAGAGVGSYTAGISTGYAHSTGTVGISTSGYSYSAQIYDLPMEAEEAGYGFNWRMVAYQYKDEQNEFPIVTYLVNDVQQGPLLPSNFSQNEENTTKDQVALTWDYTGSPAGFIISKYYKSAGSAGFYELAYVRSGDESSIIGRDGITRTYQYIDEGLDPDTEYQYQIQTVSNYFNVKSVPSETLVCYTLPAAIVPDVKVMSEELTAYPDTPTTLSTYLNNEEALEGRKNTYQWQKYDEAEKTWNNLKGKTGTSYVIQNAGLDDEGKYRCVVNSVGGNTIVSSKSPVVKVTYSKRQVVCDSFTIDKNTGTARLALRSKDSNSIPSGLVYFKVSGTGYEQEFVTGLDEKGVATAKLDVPDGAYRVTVDYQGSRVFSASRYDKINGKPVFFTPGLKNDAVVLDYADSYTYGDKLNILQYTIDKEGNVEKAEEINYKNAVFGIEGNTYVDSGYSGVGLEYAEYDHTLFDLKDHVMADGTQPVTPVIYKFADKMIKFPDEKGVNPDKNGEMREQILDRFAKGYAAYAGTVYMRYNDQFIKLNIAQKHIDLYVDMSGVPEIVNAGAEAEKYYSQEAIRSYLNSDEMPTFGEGVKKDLDYLDAGNIVVRYWDDKINGYATGSLKIEKESGLDLKKPSTGSYTFKRTTPSWQYIEEGAPYRYTVNEHLGTDTVITDLGINNDITTPVEFKDEDETVKAARLKMAASIADCYEWNNFSKELTVSSGELMPCMVEAAKVNGVEAGTVEEISPAKYAYYPVGTKITFEAYPYEGYEVDYWELNGKKVEGETSGTLRVTQTSEGTKVVVHFKRRPIVLTYDMSPKNATVNGKAVENKIQISPAVKNGSVVTYGAKITAEALPAKGWHLKEWEYQPEKLAARFVTDPVFEFEMPNKNVRLYANFERDSYKLTLAEGLAAYDEKGAQISSDAYVTGDTVVTIKKAPGYEFSGTPSFTTSVKTTDKDSDGKTYTFVMLADTTVSANVYKDGYKVTIGECEHGEITVTDQDGKKVDLRRDLEGGTKLILTAVPDRGYRVSGWNGKASNKDIYNLTVGENMTVTASFTEKAYKEVAIGSTQYGDYIFSVDGERVITKGGKVKVYEDEVVTVENKPHDNYMVAGWNIYEPDKEGHDLKVTYVADTETSRTLEYSDNVNRLAVQLVPVNVINVSGQVAAGEGTLSLYSDNNILEASDYIGMNTALTCVASPKEGYEVSGWSVNGNTLTNTTDSVLVLDDVKDDTVVTVSFKAVQAAEGKSVTMDEETVNGTVFVNTKPGISIDKVPAGTKVYLTAVAKDGYETKKLEVFKKTGGDSTEAVTLDNDMAFTMPENNVIVKATFKEILLHDHVLVIDKKVEPTCTETGLTKGSHCSECGEVIVPQEEIPALGHILVTEPGEGAICDNDGITEKIECDVCGEVIKEHEKIPANGHKNVVIEEAKPATFTANGYTETKICSTCSRKEGGDVIYRIDTVVLENDSYTYEGNAITPAVIAKDSAGQTIDSEFYTVSYSSNNSAGTGKAIVTFKDKYSGIKELVFTIKAEGSGENNNNQNNNNQNGNDQNGTTQNGTTQNGTTQNGTTQNGTTQNKTTQNGATQNGTTGNSTGQDTTVQNEQALTKVIFTSVKNIKTRIINVSYKAVTGAKGYQVQYSMDKKFKKGVKTLKTAGTTVKTKKLKKGKTYYVRARAWKKDASGNRVYGAWSKTAKVKIKK